MEVTALKEINPKSLWHHPVLPIFAESKDSTPVDVSTKLYLVPTLDNLVGEDIDQEFLPKPSPLTDLPDISNWVKRYVIGVIEIWSNKRPPIQLARWSHRKVYKQLISPSQIGLGARIRRIYIGQPIDGVAEATITLQIGNRVRSLSLRFEGVDKRWLCTELVII
jgi:hypothetical protein